MASIDTPARVLHVPTPLYNYHRSFPILPGSWIEYSPNQPPHTRRLLARGDSSSKSKMINTIRVLTWNVWFEAMFQVERALALLECVKANKPDVCCFQEVTNKFEETLRTDKDICRDWIMTSFDDQSKKLTKSWYGTMIMVRKKLLEGYDANPSYVPFLGSTTGRCLTVLELVSRDPQASETLRIGTIHLDYTPELRKTELDIIAQALLAPTASGLTARCILCGDTNFNQYAEAQPLLDSGFVDAWIAVHPPKDPSQDLFLEAPTFAVAGIKHRDTGEQHAKGAGSPRRLDLMLSSRLTPKEATLLGADSIPNKQLAISPPGLAETYLIYPSDHLGVSCAFSVE